jgi:hypothetical protein
MKTQEKSGKPTQRESEREGIKLASKRESAKKRRG